MNSENPAIERSQLFGRLLSNRRLLIEKKTREGPLSADIRLLSAIADDLDRFFILKTYFLNQSSALPQNRETEKEAAFFGFCRRIVSEQADFFREIVLPKLLDEHILYDSSVASDRALLHDRFEKIVFPALTPLVLDASHPFPRLQNRTLNLAAALRRDGKAGLGLVQVPPLLPRCFLLSEQPPVFIFLETMIMEQIPRLFSDPVTGVSSFRVTRKEMAAEETEPKGQGRIVRLEIQTPVSSFIKQTLMKVLKLGEKSVFLSASPLDLSCLTAIGSYMDEHRPPLICP